MVSNNKQITIHEVQDKSKIPVDQDSLAAALVSSKFIDIMPSTFSRGFTPGNQPGDGDGDGDGEGDETTDFPAPEFSDILIKYQNAYESPNPNSGSRRYGALYTSGGYTDSVELEFKVMIPVELASQIVGVQVLSGNEVIAES
jgi:hypothetical protein